MGKENPLTQQNSRPALVVTSIASPNAVLRELAEGCRRHGYPFYLIGDMSSPKEFVLEGCEFYDLARQQESGLRTAELCPTRHYARKNVGYLLAIRAGAEVIVETDDDNIPLDGFWQPRQKVHCLPVLRQRGHINVYRYFHEGNIWPRGLPLPWANVPLAPFEKCPEERVVCPIQQGLADENPDVDAIYRLLMPLPISFRKDRRLALAEGAWCPFNSQNTAFWRDAFALLYLPSYCTFRMTDIWRSFVAQAVLWANGWKVLFHGPTVIQARNEHDLMRDFRDELPGYLNNETICSMLARISLRPGADKIGDNLHHCYQELVKAEYLPEKELPLVDAWLDDLAACSA